ncbi:hypothetical protein IFM89_000418 [Coptis chinensis]|uniref:separase n=1 Tax=Coptis chinensis TaxID=261450 RepID=A0A835I767_9MAGN|nr:hypothetical protein IFM89_000418 [Coptis chinensis]
MFLWCRSLEQSWLGPWKCLLLGELLHSTCLDTALIKMTTFLKCNFELNANQNLLRVILGGSSCISEIEECICQMLVPKCCITRSESCPNKKLNISSFTCAQAKSLSGFLHQLISEATYKLEAECIERRPVIMVLDSDVQMLPWENLPVLRKEEVYRMPSVGSISALINLTFYYQGQFGGHDATFPSIDPLDAFYLLHPTDNSNCRKGEFEDWLRDKKLKGKAETSSVEELVLALKSHDLFLYFGHGNGTQFLPKDEIEKISSCAATLLMGCSSGSLPFVGCYNPHGIVLSYLLAGSPAIIANLWEVTDKDIERFGKTVLSACLKERSTLSHECRTLVDELESVSIGSSEVSATRIASKGTKLRNDNINSRCKETTGRRSSIASFMSQAREACVFPFLIGASPVCYGVPTGIRKKDL